MKIRLIAVNQTLMGKKYLTLKNISQVLAICNSEVSAWCKYHREWHALSTHIKSNEHLASNGGVVDGQSIFWESEF